MRISDWSLDVCSSDLFGGPALSDERDDFDHLACTQLYDALQGRAGIQAGAGRAGQRSYSSEGRGRCKSEIGRASCRERVCQAVSISGVAVSLKKKKA